MTRAALTLDQARDALPIAVALWDCYAHTVADDIRIASLAVRLERAIPAIGLDDATAIIEQVALTHRADSRGRRRR